MRVVLLAILHSLERGLDALDAARIRVEQRRFQRQHPEVTFYYPDGEQAPPPT